MRAGRTKTTSFSLDDETMAALKSMAARTHRGNVSALLADFALREKKLAAMEDYLASCGDPPVTEEGIARAEAQYIEAINGPASRPRARNSAGTRRKRAA